MRMISTICAHSNLFWGAKKPPLPIREAGALSFCVDYDILIARVLPINGKRCPPWSGLTRSGALLFPPIIRKGGWPMVTYSDLIQIGILIVSLLSLIFQVTKK